MAMAKPLKMMSTMVTMTVCALVTASAPIELIKVSKMIMAAANILTQIGIGIFTQEKVGGIISKGDSHHRRDDQHGKIAQHDDAAGE